MINYTFLIYYKTTKCMGSDIFIDLLFIYIYIYIFLNECRNFKMNLFEEQSTLQSITQSKAKIPIVDIFASSIGVSFSLPLLIIYPLINLSYLLVYCGLRHGPYEEHNNK